MKSRNPCSCEIITRNKSSVAVTYKKKLRPNRGQYLPGVERMRYLDKKIKIILTLFLFKKIIYDYFKS